VPSAEDFIECAAALVVRDDVQFCHSLQRNRIELQMRQSGLGQGRKRSDQALADGLIVSICSSPLSA